MLDSVVTQMTRELANSVQEFQEKKISEDKVRQAVQSVLRTLGEAYQHTLSKDEPSAKEKLRALFFKDLSSLSDAVFDRSLLNHYQSLKEELIRLSSDLQKSSKECSLIERIEEEAKLALSLGIPAEKGSGLSKSYILKDIEGKRIGIFKPKLFNPLSKHNSNFLSRIGRCVSRVAGYRSVRHSRESIGEVFSYHASERLHFHLVPPTKYTKFDAKQVDSSLHLSQSLDGSLQMFIPGVKEAGDVLNRSERSLFFAVLMTIFRLLKSLFTPSLLRQLEKRSLVKKQEIDTQGLSKTLYGYFSIFDFLIGQTDRHWANWMIGIGDLKQQKVYGVQVNTIMRADLEQCVVAIDNGSCLPRAFPKFLEDTTTYLHSELDIARVDIVSALSEEERKKLYEELPLAIEEFLALALPHEFRKEIQEEMKQNLLKGLPKPSLHTSPQESKRYKQVLAQLSLLKMRIQVLQQFLFPPESLKEHYTFKLLASLRHKSDYERFLTAAQ